MAVVAVVGDLFVVVDDVLASANVPSHSTDDRQFVNSINPTVNFRVDSHAAAHSHLAFPQGAEVLR